MKLRRFWFITFPENKFGPKNIGVTAYTKEQAKSIIMSESLKDTYLKHLSDNINDSTEVIEDIDIRSLDQGHIIPNMGTVTFLGIWYPNLNMSN